MQTASMGERGSEQQQALGNGASAAASAEFAALSLSASDTTLELQEPAWRLLLGQLWQPPEQQHLVCKLLCCSQAMARLVHAACAGRLQLRLSRQPPHYGAEWEQQVTAYGEGYCRWLAKHARLLAALHLSVWHSQEQHVAAGLLAAAGVTMAQAASQSSAMAAVAAAAGPAPASPQPQGLPLRSLISTGGSDSSSLLDGVAACPQLTRLQLTWDDSEPQGLAAALAAALSGLHGLQELSLEVGAGVAVPALQLGTRLTKLRLVGLQLSAAAMRSLPPSLVELEYSLSLGYSEQRPPLDITHLSRLVRLSWQEQQPGDKLPPSLERAELHYPVALEPLHPLTRLQSLQYLFGACSVEQLQAAVAAIGPSLTALDVSVDGTLGRELLSQRIAGPPVLPLTRLLVHGRYNGSVAHLGQWTGLQRLKLFVDNCDIPQLAGQLVQLTALQELELMSSRLQAVQLQPLVACIVGMTSLQRLECECVFNYQQHAQLQAATQLTELRLL